MPRVGILTFHWADNFGAILQAYALQKVVGNLGYQVEIVDFRPPDLVLSYRPTLRRKELEVVYGKGKMVRGFIVELLTFLKKKKRVRLFEEFRQQFLKLSEKRCSTAEELCLLVREYNCCIVGSDQVWNPYFLLRSGGVYLLPFCGSQGKIAYAASIAESIPEPLLDFYKVHVSDFDYVSLREKSLCNYLSSVLERPIEAALDPTLLLSKEDYREIARKPVMNLHKRFLLAYNLGNPRVLRLAEDLSTKTGLPVVCYKKPLKRLLDQRKTFDHFGPREFLWLVDQADIIVTDSYHGTIFSILFEKPFFVVLPESKSVRILDLLDMLKLSDRVFRDSSTFLNFGSVDYSEIREILRDEREKSLSFLRDALVNLCT